MPSPKFQDHRVALCGGWGIPNLCSCVRVSLKEGPSEQVLKQSILSKSNSIWIPKCVLVLSFDVSAYPWNVAWALHFFGRQRSLVTVLVHPFSSVYSGSEVLTPATSLGVPNLCRLCFWPDFCTATRKDAYLVVRLCAHFLSRWFDHPTNSSVNFNEHCVTNAKQNPYSLAISPKFSVL